MTHLCLINDFNSCIKKHGIYFVIYHLHSELFFVCNDLSLNYNFIQSDQIYNNTIFTEIYYESATSKVYVSDM